VGCRTGRGALEKRKLASAGNQNIILLSYSR
jgi:hypothetical protein